MFRLPTLLFLLAVLAPPALLPAAEGPQHGPIFRLFYAPYGTGTLAVPYSYTAGSTTRYERRDSSNENDKKAHKTANGYRVSTGYYYDFLQCEAAFLDSNIKRQAIRERTGGVETETPLSGTVRYGEFRGGLRFSNPGDTSYHWLYAGVKRVVYRSDYNDTRATGLGYLLGYNGFLSWAQSSPIEFVFTYDIFFANYLKYDISSSVPDMPQWDKETRYNLGFSVGMGLQYEPYNISCVLKIMPEAHYFTKTGGTGEIRVGAFETLMGIEIIYMIPNYKYNLRD